jgi:PAS domain S-box-containing protein
MPSTQANILVVEDNLDNLRLLTQILEGKGYKVRPAPNGAVALRAAQSTPPDLILLDVMMPGMDGIQVCHQLKSHTQTRDIPVIFVSALNQPSYKVSGLSVGAVDYIPKPYEASEVLARIKIHLALREARTQLEEKNLQLKRAEEALWRVNHELETRVKDRTAELVRLNQSLQIEIGQRKLAETDLSITARRFKALVEHSSDVIAILDRAGHIRYVSPSIERLLGYKSANLIGARIFDLVHPNDLLLLTECFLETVTHSEAETLLEFRLRNGHGHWRVLTGTIKNLLHEPAVAGILINVHDITERQQAQTELRQHRDHLEELVIERTGKLEQRVEELSALNYISQVITRVTDLNSLLELMAKSLVQLFAASGCRIAIFDNEQQQLTVTADYRWADHRSSAVGRTIPLDRQSAHSQVLEITRPLVVLNPHENSSFQPLQDLIPRQTKVLMLVPLLVQEQVIGLLCLDKTDSERPFTPTKIELAETIAGQLAGAIDNARLRNEEQNQRKRVEAQNQELDAFARTVAHDIKHPLSAIYTQVEALEMFNEHINPKSLFERLKQIKQQSLRGTNIVDELLLLSRVRHEDVPTKVLDMPFIIEHVRQRLDYLLEEYHGKLLVPSSWPLASGYLPWVIEVWINYISNGLKYGGRPPCLELGAEPQADGYIRFWVRDNGPGIPLEQQAELFTEFTRLDEARAEGHGLGLSIVRRLVEKLGGTVGLQSESGQGSEFYFTLPAV